MLKNQFDEGQRVTLAMFSVHCVGAILKEYFREMEVPIVPFELYGDFVSGFELAVGEREGGERGGGEGEGEREGGEGGERGEGEEGEMKKEVGRVPCDVLKGLLEKLPELNRKVFVFFVCAFFLFWFFFFFFFSFLIYIKLICLLI